MLEKSLMLRKTLRKQLLYIFMAAIMLLPAQIILSPAVYGLQAGGQDALEITLSQGKPALVANGVSVPCVKPYRNADAYYIPMMAVLETMGADIETAADHTFTIVFRDTTVKIKAGEREFSLNGEKKLLPARPVLSGMELMVPLEFMKLCFDVTTSIDNKAGKAVITLKDDGSLTDLSFLTGSVATSKAGNSYFGWSITLPTGSRVASQTFNSKYVQFENEHYGFDIEIFADSSEGKSLKQYYDEIREDPGSVLDVEPIDSSLVTGANPQYIELLYNDSYNEAVYERIYPKGSNFIDVTVISYDEVDPSKLKNDKTIKAMLDTFNLNYNGNTAGIADLSSVNSGLAKYSNFVASESTGKKYLAWEMNILPEWDRKETSSPNPFNTEFDGNPGEYVKVELDTADDNTDIETKGKSFIDSYMKNFNPQYFTLKSYGVTQTAGYKSYGLKFDVKYGSKLYSYDERLIMDKGILYDITFKTPAESSAKAMENFEKMLGTFKASDKDTDKILDELRKNAFNLTKNNVGKDDTLTIYENKAFKWKMTLPGYWQKGSSSGQSLESFYDAKAGALVSVEASPIKAGETAKPDKERFLSMSMYDRITENLVKTDTEQFKGRNVTVYQYRIDDTKSETYADLNYYVFDEGGYRYCFMSTIPDLTSSEFNLSSIKSIWESLEIIK